MILTVVLLIFDITKLYDTSFVIISEECKAYQKK